MDSLGLFEILRSERAPTLTGKVKAANFASSHPHLLAAALGAGIAVGLAHSSKKHRRRQSLIDVGYRGALVAGGTSLAGEALRKHAGMDVGQLKTLAGEFKPEIIGGLAGAAAAGLGGYLAGRRGKKGTSYMERRADDLDDELKTERRVLSSKGKDPGFSYKVRNVYAKAYKGLAKAVGDHPGAGSVLFAGTGAPLGAELGRMVHTFTH